MSIFGNMFIGGGKKGPRFNLPWYKKRLCQCFPMHKKVLNKMILTVCTIFTDLVKIGGLVEKGKINKTPSQDLRASERRRKKMWSQYPSVPMPNRRGTPSSKRHSLHSSTLHLHRTPNLSSMPNQNRKLHSQITNPNVQAILPNYQPNIQTPQNHHQEPPPANQNNCKLPHPNFDKKPPRTLTPLAESRTNSVKIESSWIYSSSFHHLESNLPEKKWSNLQRFIQRSLEVFF